MITGILILLSLSVIYLTRFLMRKKMRLAAFATIGLYCMLLVMANAILFLEVIHPDFPNSETIYILLTESNPFRLLSRQTTILPEFTFYILRGIVSIITISIGATSLVLAHGLFHITKAIVEDTVKALRPETVSPRPKKFNPIESIETIKPILKLNCRMNC